MVMRSEMSAASVSSSRIALRGPFEFSDGVRVASVVPREWAGAWVVRNSWEWRAELSSSRRPFIGIRRSQLSRNCSTTHYSRPDLRQVEEEPDLEERLPELRDLLGLLRSRRLAQEQDPASGNGGKRGTGNVFLVGTGPGDPELLTLKAVRLMQQADLVLYDRLVSTDILNLVHHQARLLYVGKTSGFHSRTQDEIHELLLNFAEAGATVLRLKGGDPLVFGRGGEEMDFLQTRGVEVKVVPGITAASGIGAELGIPLTHRGAANSVRFLTGHSRKGGEDPLYVAEQAADPDSTLVIYMGLSTLPGLAAKLLANGLAPDTPAVAVERGTTVHQRIVFAQLHNLPGDVAAQQLVSPTLIIVGRVVALSPLWPYGSHTFTIDSEPQTRERKNRPPDPLLLSQHLEHG